MSFGAQFRGRNNEFVIGFGDNMQFHSKVTEYAGRWKFGDSDSPLNTARYVITVPTGKIPLVFIYQPASQGWSPMSLYKISDTEWHMYMYRDGTSVQQGEIELYVFVGRDIYPNDGWGIEVYNDSGGVSWNTNGPLPLFFNSYIEATIVGRTIFTDPADARVLYEPFPGSTWVQEGVSKPCYACGITGYASIIVGYNSSTGYYTRHAMRDTFVIAPSGIEIGMAVVDIFNTTLTYQIASQLTPQVIPIIDGAFYD